MSEIAKYPAIITDQLFDVVDRLSTTLSGDITATTTPIPVDSNTVFEDEGFITIENETIYYKGKGIGTLGEDVCIRGYSGTAVSHTEGAQVKLSIVAATINRINKEIIAVQTYCGTSGGTQGFINARYLGGSTAGDLTVGNAIKLGGSTEGQLNVDKVDGYDLSEGLADKTRPINLTPAGAIISATAGAEQKQVDGTYHSYYVLAFDKSSDENAFWHFDVPEKYDGGAIVIKIESITTVNSGDVVFEVATRGCGDNEVWDDNTDEATGNVTKAVNGTAGKKFIAEITINNPKWTYGDTVYFKLTRDADNASDTADADVSVVMVAIEYEVI